MAKVTKVRAEDLLLLSEAADVAVSRGRTSLHVAAQSGAIPYVVIGDRRYFARQDIETWDSLRVHEAANVAQCHPETLVGAAERGEIPGKQLVGAWHFRREDVIAWAEGRGFVPLGGSGALA